MDNLISGLFHVVSGNMAKDLEQEDPDTLMFTIVCPFWFGLNFIDEIY